MLRKSWGLWIGAALYAIGCAEAEPYDVLIQGGILYDGTGADGVPGDVGIRGGRIVYAGPKAPETARTVIDAKNRAVAPGFVNMLSWAGASLIADGRGLSDILQGVTLEVFGEGWSQGPFNATMIGNETRRQGDIKYPVTWTTLGGFLDTLTARGVSPNVASFVGATTVRIHELGEKDADPSPEQLDAMRHLVRDAMREGAMGVGSSLGYVPSSYAETPELIALASEAAKCGGMYISHIRSEGKRLAEAVDEVIEIAEKSGAPAEIYHFKASGKQNWSKRPAVVGKIEAARARGLRITADMYAYEAAATGLDIAMPPWVQEGGVEKWAERLRDPAIRARVAAEMRNPATDWENGFLAAGPDGILLAGFRNPALKSFTGKTLAEAARMRGESPEETAMKLVAEDGSRVDAIYFLMDEADVKRNVALPYMSFGSDEGATAPEGVFLLSGNHPRAYGNVARLLGHYVREEKALTLADAIRKLSGLPAGNLGLKERGFLKPGYFADVVVFDPGTIADHATYAEPKRLASGVEQVFVNGVQVVKDGTHTGAKPGKVVRGPGWSGWPDGGACKPE